MSVAVDAERGAVWVATYGGLDPEGRRAFSAGSRRESQKLVCVVPGPETR